MKRLRVLYNRPDFRRNPLKALTLRLLWRLRWKFYSDPWVLSFQQELKIAVPKAGAGALILYQGSSEPEIFDFIQKFLKKGMIFWDIGAHIGDLSIIASKAVGNKGEIHAFEPNPFIYELFASNIKRNKINNILIKPFAVSDVDGQLEFEIFDEPSVSKLKTNNLSKEKRNPKIVILVRSISLDQYLSNNRIPNLIKVDVEGSELLVFRGMKNLLSSKDHISPILIFEYNHENYKKFGYAGSEVLSFLKNLNYKIFYYKKKQKLIPFDFKNLNLDDRDVNLIALKSTSYIH
jgi:FkbM family methyltransferase